MELLQQSEIRDLPQKTVAYVRHIGPYKGDVELFNRLFEQLFSWAGSRKLMDRQDAIPLVIYHDDPCVTEEDKLRMSVCLPVPPNTPVDGEIGKMKIPGGRCLIARLVLYPQDMPKAWKWIYGTWFPSSGYQPDDRLPFEIYPVPPENGKLTVEICIPVKPL